LNVVCTKRDYILLSLTGNNITFCCDWHSTSHLRSGHYFGWSWTWLDFSKMVNCHSLGLLELCSKSGTSIL